MTFRDRPSANQCGPWPWDGQKETGIGGGVTELAMAISFGVGGGVAVVEVVLGFGAGDEAEDLAAERNWICAGAAHVEGRREWRKLYVRRSD